ncbi:MAG: DUF3137 domain-containing protein [Candidatus Melainabacteria bacterium]|nr:MAG: DUF3137 domain-containing protein [Candidatus Melainabacteria bacterium]
METNSTSSSQKKAGFWSELFKVGPSRHEIWQQLCGEINAKYVAGGFWQEDKIQLAYKTWTITCDVYKVHASKRVITYTRFRAPYVNSDGFRFHIYRAGFFSRLLVKLGMQTVKIGNRKFDNEFIIQGSNQAKCRDFFSSTRLRALIASQPDIDFFVQDKEGLFSPPYPNNVYMLTFQVPYEMLDTAQLKTRFELFKEALEQLCKIGSAFDQEPRVTL